MDQLRTLIVVHDTGTALGAARMLGREQSSVQKQLDTMNRNFREVCGEPLVLKQGRGKDVLFTGTGEALVGLARETLGDWLDGVHESRRRLGRTLMVGTTRFTLAYLAGAGERVGEDFRQRGIELRIGHVRTRDVLAKLRAKEVDLVCGSVVTRPGGDDELVAFDVMEWRRSGVSLLTNLPEERLPGPTLESSELRSLPLVVSGSGMMAGVLHAWFGADYRNRLRIAAEIDTVNYGFELLRSGLLEGCMLVTQGVADAIGDLGVSAGRGLRAVELVNDTGPRLEVLLGAFTRRGERAGYAPDHPLNMLWEALAEENEGWRREQRWPTAGLEPDPFELANSYDPSES
ncbi:LysR family transcriptional regulator [Streptomyces palmae]|uniref:LysR family transcriptional regulator n=1 Tax=Streptomyces palmae TaxID=1701085 RepID=A0A4Z0H7H8_9ACTN|nr:LysR family transcriptional regulator [Streptomyces palmae]TGB05548.1 LysR family transcriptional regulator [Streptomyces palmae]